MGVEGVLEAFQEGATPARLRPSSMLLFRRALLRSRVKLKPKQHFHFLRGFFDVIANYRLEKYCTVSALKDFIVLVAAHPRKNIMLAGI